jgi:hypothetical protein
MTDFRFTHWPADSHVRTQAWGNNPAYYGQFGLPGHEGADLKAPTGSPIFAVADGVVSQVNPTDNHNYGIFVRVNHTQSYQTTYAHLQRTAVTLNQQVAGGQIVGYADNTGNSQGSHLHLTLKRIGYVYTDEFGTWPFNIHNPTPYLDSLETTSMIGFHIQTPVNDWTQAVALLPNETWVKAVNEQGLCLKYKEINPALKVVFRYDYNKRQNLIGDYKELARAFFASFIDGTFYQQEIYKSIDAIEEWNEYLADSQDAAERARWVAWCRAVNEVWTQEYRVDPRLAHIRLVSCNTAIGNGIPLEFARIVQQHNGILAYHNYCNVHKGVITADDWQNYSGRWTTMDAAYRAAGVTVNWLMTEGGACTIGTVDGVPHTGVVEGWRHEANYNGNLNAYIQGVIKYQIDRGTAWNKANGGRLLGQVLFTVHRDPGIWAKFALFTPDMMPIAQFVKTYTPAPVVIPPPVDEWKKRAWAKSVEQQIAHGIMLNSKAALQNAITRDGLTPVLNEYSYEGRVFQAGESLTGAIPRRLYVWEAGKPVVWFNNPG